MNNFVSGINCGCVLSAYLYQFYAQYLCPIHLILPYFLISSLIFFPSLIQHLPLFTSDHIAEPVEPGRAGGEMFE